ncbi:MAG: tetratricopeptide repeat protein [Bryobacteraceae bacterium]
MFLAVLALALATSAPIQQPSPLHNHCFVEFYNADFTSAISCFARELKAKPSDPAANNHLAEAILYKQLFIHGALESELVSSTNPFLTMPRIKVPPAIASHFKKLIKKSLSLNQAELKKNPRDVRALYALGVAQGLSANYKFLIDKNWTGALHDAKADQNANEKILDIDPNFVDAYLVIGLYKYVIGNLPFYMRALGYLGGFGAGNKKEGIQEIEEVSRKGILDRYGADMLLCVLFRREHEPQKALPILKTLAAHFPRNYLFLFEEAEMYSDLGKKKAALDVIDRIETLRRQNAPGYARVPLAKIAYLRANLLFWYNDLGQALASSKTATNTDNHLDRRTRTMAWLRLGQVYDLKGDHQPAVQAYRQAMSTEPHSAAAAEAKRYISNPYRRKH